MKIKQEQIDAAFAAAGDNKEIIAVLESLFGKRETVKFKHYTDIKTYEDACEYLGINPLPEDCSCTFTSSVDYKPTSDEIAYAKLKIIAKAIRGGEDFSFKKAIENGVNEKLKGKAPKAGTQKAGAASASVKNGFFDAIYKNQVKR